LVIERKFSGIETLCIKCKYVIQKLIGNVLYILKVLRYDDKPKKIANIKNKNMSIHLMFLPGIKPTQPLNKRNKEGVVNQN
jgi:hypothetical protein